MCPWDQYTPVNLEFCEAVLCGWIKQPGNTWSNVGFLVVGAWIWVDSIRRGARSLRLLAAAAIITGLGSAFYHASGIFWGGVADYAGMFLATGAMTALNVRRWLQWKKDRLPFVALMTSLVLLGVFLVFPEWARALYVLAAPCCFIELRLFFRDRARTKYSQYHWAWILALLGAAVWWLDASGKVCNSENHILSGHALWHLLMAASFIPLHRFYLQFPELTESYRRESPSPSR